jgi:hypothetical protein
MYLGTVAITQCHCASVQSEMLTWIVAKLRGLQAVFISSSHPLGGLLSPN